MMRRKDRELTDRNDIIKVVDSCRIAHIGMIDDGKPYVTALSFGYKDTGDALELYFHTANEGRMLGALRKNPKVFFQMHTVDELRRGTAENPCTYSWLYDSVTGSGSVSFIAERRDKQALLNNIIRHLDSEAKEDFVFPEQMLDKITVFKIVSKDIAGKRRSNTN